MPETIGDYIRRLRTSRNLGLRKLSQLMDYPTHAYLYQIEKGKTNPSKDFLEKLSSVLSLTPQERTTLKYLAATAGVDLERDLTPLEHKLNELLEETGIVVGAYTGDLSQDEIRVLIERIQQWREENGDPENSK